MDSKRSLLERVKAQVKERLAIFSKGGGFVFNSIHNVVAKTPLENVLAMFEAFHEFNAKGVLQHDRTCIR